MAPPTHTPILSAGLDGSISAIRAAQLGAYVTVIERENLGGIRLNWVCISSRAFLSKSSLETSPIHPMLADGMMEEAENVEGGATMHMVQKKTGR
jgi:dihydrolipoamide dehydrogenase